MMIRLVFAWCLLAAGAGGDNPDALFEEAERLARSSRNEEAMAKVEEAIARIDQARAAGEELSWQGRNGLRFAARLAREAFLDYEKSLRFCDKLTQIADTDYWRTPARLERAMTYRAMGDFEKAQNEYAAIAASDARYRQAAVLPRAEMVYFDMGESDVGRKLIVEAVKNSQINGRERFNTLRRCAQEAMSRGDRMEALAWYGLVAEIPFEKAKERADFLTQAWYEMGRIEESRGRTVQAKGHYRAAMEIDEGDMRFRARARDALESIEYFE